MAVDLHRLVPELLRGYALSPGGIHGLPHWGRVLDNGLRLAAVTGARVDVVTLFAVFHDARRVNDSLDPWHGRRGADLARRLHGTLFELDDGGLELLCQACGDHTRGWTEAEVTVQTCWDADRLDLARVGIWPTPRKLCTEAARDPALIAWANERAVARQAPESLNDLVTSLARG